jgi:hypothetical protein
MSSLFHLNVIFSVFLLERTEIPNRAGEYRAIPDFINLPTAAIEAFRLYCLCKSSLTGVHPEKQGVELGCVFLYLRKPRFDYSLKIAWWRNKAGRFIAVDQRKHFIFIFHVLKITSKPPVSPTLMWMFVDICGLSVDIKWINTYTDRGV